MKNDWGMKLNLYCEVLTPSKKAEIASCVAADNYRLTAFFVALEDGGGLLIENSKMKC